MKCTIIHGKYKHWKTHWYYGRDEKGNVIASTRSREVPIVDGEVRLGYGCSRMVYYCPKCGVARCIERRYSRMECEECDRYRTLFTHFPRLAEKLAEGGTALDEEDVEYLMRKAREEARGLLSVLRLFDVPEEVRARILAKIL